MEQYALWDRLASNAYGANYGDAGFTIDDYMNSKNAFGISKKNNPFSKGNIKGTIGGMASMLENIPTGERRGIFDTLDPLHHLAGGRESKVGNAVGDAGVGIFKMGAQSGNGALMLAGGIAKGIGSLINAGWGIKENKANIAAIDANTSAARSAGAQLGSATNNNQILAASGNMVSGLGFKARDLYKDGWFTNKGTRKGNAKINTNNSALAFQTHGLATGIDNVDYYNDSDTMRNFGAFGGPFDIVDPATAIGYSIYTDRYLKDKAKEKGTNILSGIPNNIYNIGGVVQTKGANFTDNLMHINAGAMHEQNPNGGVQLGVDSQGIPNLVEEDEVVFNDYVFSNRLKVPKGKIGNYGKRNMYAEGGKLEKENKGNKEPQVDYSAKLLKKVEGMTFADAAKKIEKITGADERPNDPIAQRGMEAMLAVLAQVQEKEREKERLEQMQEAIDQMTPEEFAMLQQQMAAAQQAPTEEELALQQQQEINPTFMQEEQALQPEQLEAAYGGKLFKYGGSFEKFSKELSDRGLNIADYIKFLTEQDKLSDELKAAYAAENAAEAIQKDFDEGKHKELAESYLKEVKAEERKVERLYRKKGINPNKLKDAGLQKYKEDVLTATRNPELIDSDTNKELFINQVGKGNSKSFNVAANNNIVTAARKGAFGDPITLNSAGRFNIDYPGLGEEQLPQGYDLIEDMWTQDATNGNQWIDSKGNIVENPYGKDTKFRMFSEFDNQDALRDYYKNEFGKRVKYLHPDQQYTDEDLDNITLNKEDVDNWIQDLGSEENTQKNKELANILRGLEIDENNGLQRGQELQLNANPSRFQLVDSEDNPTGQFINYTGKFGENENPLYNIDWSNGNRTNGVTTYNVRTGEINPNIAVIDGKYYNIGDDQAAQFAEYKADEEKVKKYPKFETPVTGYSVNPTYYDIPEEGLTKAGLGTMITQEPKDESFPKPPTWPYWVGMGLQAGALGYNIFKPIDYSNSDALINAAKEAGTYAPIEYKPLGNHLVYKPDDPWFYTSPIIAQSNATQRAITNKYSPSQSADTIANAYNTMTALGKSAKQQLENNSDRYYKYTLANNDLDKAWSEGFLKADMANQEAARRAAGYKLEGLKSGYTMRQALQDAKANAINAGISGLANLAYNYAANKYNQDLMGWGMRNNAWGPGIYFEKDAPKRTISIPTYVSSSARGSSAAKGGKLKVRRNKGLGF